MASDEIKRVAEKHGIPQAKDTQPAPDAEMTEHEKFDFILLRMMLDNECHHACEFAIKQTEAERIKIHDIRNQYRDRPALSKEEIKKFDEEKKPYLTFAYEDNKEPGKYITKTMAADPKDWEWYERLEKISNDADDEYEKKAGDWARTVAAVKNIKLGENDRQVDNFVQDLVFTMRKSVEKEMSGEKEKPQLPPPKPPSKDTFSKSA